MKIVILISSLRCGGTEHTVSLLANRWVERGDQVDILTLSGKEIRPFFELDARVKHVSLGVQTDSSNALAGLLNNLKRISAIRLAFRESKPDVIVAFMEGTNVLAIISGIGLGIPVVVSEVTVPAIHRTGLAWSLLRRFLYPFASALVVPSTGVREYFEERMKVRCEVIPNPIAEPAHTRGAGPNGRPDGLARQQGQRLVAAGRLSPEKGFDNLLRAFALVHEKHPEASLTIFGEGPLRPSLETLREELKLQDSVSLPGTTARLAQEFANFDLFVLSSRYEGFGNALCEAMAAGLAVVSFDCPTGPREIIRNGIDGILVPAEDTVALATELSRLLDNEAERAALAARAPEILMRYGLESIAKTWRDLLQPLVTSA